MAELKIIHQTNDTLLFRLFEPMNNNNNTTNDSLSSNGTCVLQNRVYSSTYLFFKLLNSTYLRLLIGPGILLNTLCLIVLSRPRLSSKSTTIVFLRFLAFFDILSITLKYLRAEINYQSTEKGHEIFFLTIAGCKILYVLMNSSISIAMWIIVLMSLDKAVAVTYPLKSSIWITYKRVIFLCCATIIILLLANLSFIKLSGMQQHHRGKYCALNENSVIVDILTASILPMALITAANIIITIVLRRVARASLDCRLSEDTERSYSDPSITQKKFSYPSSRFRPSSTSVPPTDIISATKQRTTAQVTRMLLAVTLSLIICNIPNTIYLVLIRIYDARKLVPGRECIEVTDRDISLYKLSFYSSVIQDILSDLPHIFNFFLYCVAGKKFRSIFINEVHQFLLDLRLIKGQQRRFTQNAFSMQPELTSRTGCISKQGRPSNDLPVVKTRKTVEVLFSGKTAQTLLKEENQNLIKKSNSTRHTIDDVSQHSPKTLP